MHIWRWHPMYPEQEFKPPQSSIQTNYVQPSKECLILCTATILHEACPHVPLKVQEFRTELPSCMLFWVSSEDRCVLPKCKQLTRFQVVPCWCKNELSCPLAQFWDRGLLGFLFRPSQGSLPFGDHPTQKHLLGWFPAHP